MPHFDQFGDTWLCQAPNHKGNRVMGSQVRSAWRCDVTGNDSAGNACPTCVTAFDKRPINPPYIPPVELNTKFNVGPYSRCLANPNERRNRKKKEEREPLNRLDYADDPAEYGLQLELQRLGIENEPAPAVCPECGVNLKVIRGMVGETVLVCDKHGIVWEDQESAIRNVI